MRDDIREILFEGNEDRSSTFKRYASADVIGGKILESIWKKTCKGEDGKMHFLSDDREGKTGFMSDVFGCACVFALMTRMGVKLPEEYKPDLEGCLIGVLDYINNKRYDLAPYVSEEKNSKLFSTVYPYTGAMTWTLSLLANVRKAIKSGLLTLDESYDKIIVKHIKKIINKFNESIIGSTDEPLGWNYTGDCKEPSLFYTYSVLEAFSDFEDNIMLDNGKGDGIDTELLALINDNKGGEHIEQTWSQLCRKVAENVWQKYKDILKTDLVSDDFLENIRRITKDDILKCTSSNALFDTIYIVFILVYGYANVREDQEECEDVVATMDAALQNVQKVYEQLAKVNKDYIVDTFYINFQSVHLASRDDPGKYMRLLNAERIADSSIIPMLVKANNLIAFYISKYPQKQMSSLFLELFERMSTQGWIWDNKNYSVEDTERYIEAIADFYMYYDEYEREYAERLKSKKDLEKEAEDRVAKRIEKRILKQAREDVAAEHAKEIDALKQSYAIENLLRASVRKMFCELLTETFSHIIDHNYGKLRAADLADHEKTMLALLGDLVYSFMDEHVRVNTAGEDEEELTRLRTKLKADAENFVDAWVGELKNNKNEQGVLAKLIEEEK